MAHYTIRYGLRGEHTSFKDWRIEKEMFNVGVWYVSHTIVMVTTGRSKNLGKEKAIIVTDKG